MTYQASDGIFEDFSAFLLDFNVMWRYLNGDCYAFVNFRLSGKVFLLSGAIRVMCTSRMFFVLIETLEIVRYHESRSHLSK